MTEPNVPEKFYFLVERILDKYFKEHNSCMPISKLVLEIQKKKTYSKTNYETLSRWVRSLASRGLIYRYGRGYYYA